MLSPHDRSLLLEALRPPAGRPLDWGLFTSYSLDLTALLSLPLAFVGFERASSDEVADPLVLLAAIRRNAGRLTVFCQAGEMLVPRKRPRLLHELENCVIECLPRKVTSSFHPKVALLRYSGEGTTYRFLCASRNLTHDRSWDTLLALDGELDGGRSATENEPLVAFFQALSGWSVRGVPDEIESRIRVLGRELGQVRFDPPSGFRSIKFWPTGLSESGTWPFTRRASRSVIVSPFVSDGCLERLAQMAGTPVLVSRPESLDALRPATLERYPDVRVLSEVEEVEPEAAPEPELQSPALRGLHAKLYVLEERDSAFVFTGSANATDAAFGGNVEMLVELEGPKARCGIDALLGRTKGATSLADLLTAYVPPAQPVADDAAGRALDDRLRLARIALVQSRLLGRVERGDAADQHRLALLASGERQQVAGVEVRAWPLTLPEGSWARSVEESGAELAAWTGISLAALTPFIAFEARARDGDREATGRFVLNVPLHGAPDDRLDRLLEGQIGSSAEFLRLLRLMLADDLSEEVAAEEGAGPPDLATDPASLVTTATRGEIESPVLESLLKTLDRDPDRLDQIAALVERLQRTPAGTALLPKGFCDAWQAIWPVRQELRR